MIINYFNKQQNSALKKLGAKEPSPFCFKRYEHIAKGCAYYFVLVNGAEVPEVPDYTTTDNSFIGKTVNDAMKKVHNMLSGEYKTRDLFLKNLTSVKQRATGKNKSKRVLYHIGDDVNGVTVNLNYLIDIVKTIGGGANDYCHIAYSGPRDITYISSRRGRAYLLPVVNTGLTSNGEYKTA